jgi:hypothetical protein
MSQKGQVTTLEGRVRIAERVEAGQNMSRRRSSDRDETMTVYSYAEARERLAVLLERALTEGKLRNCDGRVFIRVVGK